MKIVFLHGLESTPESSSTGKMLKEIFPDVDVLDYNPRDSYVNIVNRLQLMLNKYDDCVVVGISAGGFWALKMTEYTRVNKIVLINPAIEKACEKYGCDMDTPVDVYGSVILNMDDEVVDNKKNLLDLKGRFFVKTFETGGHRASNKEEIIEELRKSLNFLGVWVP